MNRWIPEVDIDCRMWKCPECNGRVIGHPMNFSTRNFNPYFYCPYCGNKLQDSVQDNLFNLDLEVKYM